MWQRSFVAMTVLAGGTVDDAIAALPISPVNAVGKSNAEPLVTKLRASSRAARATALAEALREIALAVEGVALG